MNTIELLASFGLFLSITGFIVIAIERWLIRTGYRMLESDKIKAKDKPVMSLGW